MKKNKGTKIEIENVDSEVIKEITAQALVNDKDVLIIHYQVYSSRLPKVIYIVSISYNGEIIFEGGKYIEFLKEELSNDIYEVVYEVVKRITGE